MSLFGQTSSTPSLFGSLNTAQKPAQTTTPTTSTPASAQTQQPGGLFGAAPAQTSGSGFLSLNTSSQPASTGGLFGTAASSQPQTTGLFGAAATTTQSQATSLSGSTLGGSLFGQSTQPDASKQQSGGGLFGNVNATSKPAQPSLFGAPTTAQQEPAKSSLFGGLGASTTTTAQRPSLFSTSNTQPAQSSFLGSTLRPGGLTLGQSTSQSTQNVVPGVKIDVSNLRGTSRFSDLHEELQKQIEQMDNFIRQQIAFKEQCDALMPAHENSLSTIPADVNYVKERLQTCEIALDNDTRAIATAKSLVLKDRDEAMLSFQAVENLKLPQQFHHTGGWQSRLTSGLRTVDENDSQKPSDLLSLFDSTAAAHSETLEVYASRLSEIETHLGNVENNTLVQMQQLMVSRGRESGARTSEDDVRELAAVLKEFESGILGVAEKIGRTREHVVGLVE